MNGPFSTGSTTSRVAAVRQAAAARFASVVASHAASSGPMNSASGRSSSCSRVARARGERLVDVDDVAVRDRRRRPGARSNRTCSPAPGATASRRRAAACSRRRSTAGAPSSSARSSRSSSPPVRRDTLRRPPFRGRGGCRGAGPSGGAVRRLRTRDDLGPCCASRSPRATARRRRRRGRRARRRRDPTTPAARDDARADRDPDRRAIRAEQAIRAVTEDVEAGRQLSVANSVLLNSSSSARRSRCS